MHSEKIQMELIREPSRTRAQVTLEIVPGVRIQHIRVAYVDGQFVVKFPSALLLDVQMRERLSEKILKIYDGKVSRGVD